MNLIWILLLPAFGGHSARAARRLWQALPIRNAGFGWTVADMWGRP